MLSRREQAIVNEGLIECRSKGVYSEGKFENTTREEEDYALAYIGIANLKEAENLLYGKLLEVRAVLYSKLSFYPDTVTVDGVKVIEGIQKLLPMPEESILLVKDRKALIETKNFEKALLEIYSLLVSLMNNDLERLTIMSVLTNTKIDSITATSLKLFKAKLGK